MTDADTLALAYFRQEYQIEPQPARLLWALWTADSRLTMDDLAQRAEMTRHCVKVALCKLRPVTDIEPTADRARSGRWHLMAFRLTPHAKAEISRLMVSATQGLIARIAA